MLLQTRHDNLTHRIVGCAMAVHRELGNGFQEFVYQRCLSIEMKAAGLGFQREIELPIFYKGTNVGSRRVDFLVEEVVLVELKAMTQLTALHYAQIVNYLEAYKLEVGLLINFGEASLKHKRFLKTQPRPTQNDTPLT